LQARFRYEDRTHRNTNPVGAVECNEAAIFASVLEPGAKDQKIAGFASSYARP
jgi:hypothetical protein